MDGQNDKGCPSGGLSPSQESRNRQGLSMLEQDTATLAREHLRMCRDKGIHLLIVQAYRSQEEQAKLYAKGRTAPGRIVTNALPGTSWHNHRRAYDVAVVVEKRIDWLAEGRYERAGEIGKALGLVWGGEFRGLRDLGHYEYHPGLTIEEMKLEA